MSLLRGLASRSLQMGLRRQLMTSSVRVEMMRPVPRDPEPYPIEDHSTFYKFERYFIVSTMPLIPAAYFIHTPTIDAILTAAIVLHVHWGTAGIVSDYARPYVLGEQLAGLAQKLVYVFTAILFAGLLHFNTNDVGLTKAFAMVWAL